MKRFLPLVFALSLLPTASQAIDEAEAREIAEAAAGLRPGNGVRDACTARRRPLDTHRLDNPRWSRTAQSPRRCRASDATFVRSDHTGWAEVSDCSRDCSTSGAYFLESLESLIEEGKGTPESVAPSCDS
jgi:hypothetical protein